MCSCLHINFIPALLFLFILRIILVIFAVFLKLQEVVAMESSESQSVAGGTCLEPEVS